MRRGKRLALDVGKVRIGVAVCDPEGILATPLDAVLRTKDSSIFLSELCSIISVNEIIEVYVGEPISLNGSATESTQDAREVALALSEHIDIPVRMIDERLTTVTAAAKLRSAGLNSKSSKQLIDSASAVEILELGLSIERKSGIHPGTSVGDQIGA